MADTQDEYRDSDEVIDQVCDWIAMKWTRSMIAFKLREMLDKDITGNTVKFIIKVARARIVKRYHISPEEFKGEQIAWYEMIMRGIHKASPYAEGVPAKMCDRLRAAERLDALLNLENVSNDDPAEQAKKIHAFLRAAEATFGQDTDKDKSQYNKPSTNEEQGDGKESESKSG